MLARAEPRGVYDRLAKAELTAHILALPAGSVDLIVSADTLCYFGDLAAVTQASVRALAPQGWLMFTVEALPEDAAEPFHLNPHGRYSHRADYVSEVLAGAGLQQQTLQPVHLRTEGGKPVAGFVVSACKTEAARSSS
jgi:predicted TPR repeat methyltransferase